MAAFHPVEFFGIAADRHIALGHRRRCPTPSDGSEISFSSVDVDETIITCNAIVKASLDLRPSPSPSDLVPEDCFDDVWDYVAATDLTHGGVSRMDLFEKSLHRHDEIALSLAKTIPPAQLYEDYVPCPGSGPGTPALSVASNHPVAPRVVEVPPPFNEQLRTLDIPQSSPTESARGPLARCAKWVSDSKGPWLATVMGGSQDKPVSPDETAGLRQETPGSTITLDGYDVPQQDTLPSFDGPIAVDREFLEESTRKRALDSIEDEERLTSLKEMCASKNPNVVFSSDMVTSLTDAEFRNSKRGQGRPRQYKKLRMRQTESPPQKNSLSSQNSQNSG
ncbi:hypothetical protein OQA88_7684 [Cercophora sp. LCS_1]